MPHAKIIRTFARPHHDHGNIMYEKVYNSSFHHKIESVLYNTCLAITGEIKLGSH